MNPARFGDWEQDQVDWLASHGTPRREAERIMGWARREGERLARENEDERQFVMDFRALGSRVLAEREGKSQQAIRDRYNKLLGKETLKDSLAHDLRAA